MAELATITAKGSKDGLSSARYLDPLPAALARNGVDTATWNEFLANANAAVRFRWTASAILGFVANQHNKNICPRMRAFAEAANRDKVLSNVRVRYEMKTETITVHLGSGQLVSHHRLIFDLA